MVFSSIRRLRRPLIVIAIMSPALLFVLGCDNGTTPTSGGNGTDTTGFPFRADDFSPAESCQPCHPQHYAEWSGSMHAYALKDPVFAAIRKVGQSAYINALDGACTQCHSPIGKRSGDIKWGPFTLSELSPVSQEGIGCDLCHTVTAISSLSNAGIEFAPSDTKYGGIKDPVDNPFHESAEHPLYKTSEYCGACHDFVTDGGFELETTFREWRSAGFAQTGKECADCHMPAYTGPAAVGGPERTVHRHTFVGVDLALIDFPNRTQQLALVTEMLRSALTMNVAAPATATAGNPYNLQVQLTNDRTGHSVPSGVPFNRQMWLSIVVRDGAQNVVYTSGQLDANDDLMDEYSEFPERDPDLFNAQATMLRADGTPTGNTWEAADLINPAIAPGETRTVDYSFTVPASAVDPLTVEVTLRFRSFPPYLLRGLGLDSLLPVPIIDMAGDTLTVTVQP